MPLAIIAGLAFLALEVAALAWLFHWLFAGTVSFIVIAAVIVLAMTATLIAWASVSMASHADTELDRYMNIADDAEVAHNTPNRMHRVSKKPIARDQVFHRIRSLSAPTALHWISHMTKRPVPAAFKPTAGLDGSKFRTSSPDESA